jgi:putative membrane protein
MLARCVLGRDGVLVLLFVSPLCALSSALFSVRVAHHVIFTAVAAPLLMWGLPRSRRSRERGDMGGGACPAVLGLARASALCFCAIERSDFWAMQAVAAGQRDVLSGARCVRRRRPTAILLLLAMMVQMGLLGALITFAGAALRAALYHRHSPGV